MFLVLVATVFKYIEREGETKGDRNSQTAQVEVAGIDLIA